MKFCFVALQQTTAVNSKCEKSDGVCKMNAIHTENKL